MKKFTVFILSVSVIIASLFALTACNGKLGKDDLQLGVGKRPEFDSLFSAEDSKLINSAIAEGADESVKKAAVMALFNTANKSRKETPLSLMLQNSEMGLRFDVPVVMHGFNLKNGDKWYYQLVTEVQSDNELVSGVMQLFAGFLKVAYATGNGEYYYAMIQGADSECNCKIETFPYADFKLTQDPILYSEENFKKELHYLESMHEINNMQFCEEIIADGSSITYDAEKGIYSVHFEINMNADSELIKKWYAKAQEDMQVSNNSIDCYNYYYADFEVWDNGYAKSFSSHSDRDAGLAGGTPVDKFTYFWTEEEIMALLGDDASIPEGSEFETIDEYVEYYSHPYIVAAKPNKTKIALIAIGSAIGALIVIIIAAVITVNVLLKKGKLPRLQAKKDAKKQKKLERKEARKQKKLEKSEKKKE